METEAKFYLSDLVALENKLVARDAKLEISRTHEYNLRFDTSDGAYTRTYRVIRLRRDGKIRLTYKGPGEIVEGVRTREEIEFEVSDFDAAQTFIESLGFNISFVYEKYRTTYHYGNCEIVLDETPYGNFIEIEGESGRDIQALAESLGLRWEARINDSYFGIFQMVRAALGVRFRDMTFANFAPHSVAPLHLGVTPADTP